MNNSILTTTTKNTTPHTKLNDEQLNPHNNKNTTPHRKLSDEQLCSSFSFACAVVFFVVLVRIELFIV
jgi:hypothetical protein